MPSIKVYGIRNGSSFRVHWMLAELDLPYESVKIDLGAGEHKKPEYLAINPAGQIPTMVYDNFVLPESTAIVHYLAEKHGPNLFGEQTPESHGNALRWELFDLLNIDKNVLVFALKKWGYQVEDARIEKAKEELAKYLPVFEANLAQHAYVAGNAFTISDVVTRTSFRYAEAGEFDLSAYPAITAWMKLCADRPAYQKAMQE